MSQLTQDLDTLADHFVAARGEDGGIEADQLLAGLSERLFGITSEPVEIGRYVVLRRLGSGGMGVVYLGYDRELDRNVAIKLLRARGTSGEAKDRAAARLLREARALARIDHPNVIAVYEVGTDRGAVFIAMERVLGQTLADWQCEQKRDWRKIVELYTQAGRGLAAAHAAGLIHRDFKPSNVLVDTSGDGLEMRARVVDFGLARSCDEPSTLEPNAHTTTTPTTDLSIQEPPHPSAGDSQQIQSTTTAAPSHNNQASASLTATGVRLGTPAYMAPEQIEGRHADARSDQFSFALALYEALIGERAFVGDSMRTLHAAVLSGRRRPPPRGRSKIPGWLSRLLDRALSTAPERRFPSMLALLAELDRGLDRRRRRGLVLGGLGLSITAALIGSAASQPERCTGGKAAISEVWNPELRARLRAAFTATDKPFAAKASEQAVRRLDLYASQWAEMHDEACSATHLRGEESSFALDLRMLCLGRRKAELHALVELFTEKHLDPQLVSRAVEASFALAPIDSCADLEALAATEPLPDDPRRRAQVDALRKQLAAIKAQRYAGRYDAALLQAKATRDAAQKLGYRPLEAEAASLLGSLLGLVGDADQAAIVLDEAFTHALASGHTEAGVRAATTAVHSVGVVGHHGDEGRRWAHLADPLIDRLGNPPRARATLASNLGNVAVLQGELDEAEKLFTAAIEQAEATLGADDILLAKTSANLGAVYRRKGELELALQAYRRAGAIFEVNFGPRHPFMATLANSTAVVLQKMGDDVGAEKNYRRVLALSGNSIAAHSPTLGHSHNNLGELLLERGDLEGAAEHYGEAIEIWEASLGEQHPLIAHALIGLGRALLADGNAEEAIALLRRALELRENAEVSAADLDEARAELDTALAALEAEASGR
ncbi:MAG TPA: serine/threonine protein kinase [Nannocystis exedens]|nr:serine/threonine protein kinase [Nannocystis exedens]